MKKTMFFLSACLLVTSCYSPDGGGCTEDGCDDGRDETVDRCEPDGFCSHTIYRDVPGGCEVDDDCEDGDPDTADTCSAGTCQRVTTTTIEIPAPFDPSAPERQDARTLCEMPLTCETGNIANLNSTCYSEVGRLPWSSYGYFLGVSHGPLATTVIHAAPRLWVGDRRDRFYVTVTVDSARVVVDREMDVEGIEAGFDIDIGDDGRSFTVHFQPAGELNSRTLQWAFLPGDIVDGDGNDLTTCLQTGHFVTVPQHGFLTLEVTDDNRLACTGVPRTVTPLPTLISGWVREESDPVLHYAYLPPAPYRRIFDLTAVEGFDWIGPVNEDTVCSEVTVVPDGSLFGATHEEIGIRPGTLVTWTDDLGESHNGIADRNLTIRDFGSADPAAPGESPGCSSLSTFLGGTGCAIDMDPLMERYTFVPASPGDFRPYDLRETARIWEYFW